MDQKKKKGLVIADLDSLDQEQKKYATDLNDIHVDIASNQTIDSYFTEGVVLKAFIGGIIDPKTPLQPQKVIIYSNKNLDKKYVLNNWHKKHLVLRNQIGKELIFDKVYLKKNYDYIQDGIVTFDSGFDPVTKFARKCQYDFHSTKDFEIIEV